MGMPSYKEGSHARDPATDRSPEEEVEIVFSETPRQFDSPVDETAARCPNTTAEDVVGRRSKALPSKSASLHTRRTRNTDIR